MELQRLLADPELVEEYRRRARDRAKGFSWEAVTDRYEELLGSLLAASRPGPLPASVLDGPLPASALQPEALIVP